jgi:hypothetical protein
MIFAGHWGKTARDFLATNNVPNPAIVSGCGNYLGFITCFSGDYVDEIDPERKIPDFPNFGQKPLAAEKALSTIKIAIRSAQNLAKHLCNNRKKFCDDGEPQRYECGAKNQRCDSVTITLTCDGDMVRLLTMGIGPNGNQVRDLPDNYSKSICGKPETLDCVK